jgi:hypothetical protein
MKIGMTLHTTGSELNYTWIELDWFQINQMNSNSIEQKWDAIWYRIYWEFSSNYGVGKKKNTLKRHKSEKTPFHLSLLGNWLNKFLFGTIQRKIYSTGWLTNFEVVWPKLVSMNHCHWIFFKWYTTYVCTCNIWLISNLIFHVHF